jgi:hypothetical protein
MWKDASAFRFIYYSGTTAYQCGYFSSGWKRDDTGGFGMTRRKHPKKLEPHPKQSPITSKMGAAVSTRRINSVPRTWSHVDRGTTMRKRLWSTRGGRLSNIWPQHCTLAVQSLIPIHILQGISTPDAVYGNKADRGTINR